MSYNKIRSEKKRIKQLKMINHYLSTIKNHSYLNLRSQNLQRNPQNLTGQKNLFILQSQWGVYFSTLLKKRNQVDGGDCQKQVQAKIETYKHGGKFMNNTSQNFLNIHNLKLMMKKSWNLWEYLSIKEHPIRRRKIKIRKRTRKINKRLKTCDIIKL